MESGHLLVLEMGREREKDLDALLLPQVFSPTITFRGSLSLSSVFSQLMPPFVFWPRVERTLRLKIQQIASVETVINQNLLTQKFII